MVKIKLFYEKHWETLWLIGDIILNIFLITGLPALLYVGSTKFPCLEYYLRTYLVMLAGNLTICTWYGRGAQWSLGERTAEVNRICLYSLIPVCSIGSLLTLLHALAG